MKLYEAIKSNLRESSSMPTTEEVRDKLKKEYRDWRTRGQQQAFADDTVAKMPVGTIIDVKSANSYHDTHAIYEKTGTNKWIEHWVGNPGRSNEEEYWQKETTDYDVVDGMYNDFEDDGETSALVDNFVIKYNAKVKEAETFTFPKEVVDKVQAEYDSNKPEIKKELEEELRELVRMLKPYFSTDEIMKMKEIKAYSDAIKDPEDIWCECSEDTGSKFKPDGEPYLGVTKHAYICNKCGKYTQIG